MDPLPFHSNRFSESAFRRYEPHLKRILSTLPESTLIDPYPLSTETFLSRFRDALRGFMHHSWQSEISKEQVFSTFRFLNPRAEYILTTVLHQNIPHVLITPALRHQLIGDVRSANLSIRPASGQIDAQADPEALRCFAYLLNRGHLQTMIEFVNVSSVQLETVQREFLNVECIQEGNVTKLI